MKTFIKTTTAFLVSASAAAWLRMFFPHLSMVYWEMMRDLTLRNKIGVVVSIPLIELYNHWIYYLIGINIFLFISKYSKINNEQSSLKFLYTGGLTAALLCGLALSLSPGIEKPHSTMPLLLIYIFTGSLFGILYYRLITKHNVEAAGN